MLKDLDQMNALVQKKIKEAKSKSGVQLVPLKEVLQAIYSRPDDDGVIDKVVGPVRSELDRQDEWEKVLGDLTQEAIGALKNPKAFAPPVQVTYIVFLENLISDLKPYAGKEGFEKKLLEKIRDAKIVLSEKANHERKLKVLKSTISPSDIAAQVLVEMQKASEAAAKESGPSGDSEEASAPGTGESIGGSGMNKNPPADKK
jgi:molecular chaperone DnaK (HSP70)